MEIKRLIVALTLQMATQPGPISARINEALMDLTKVDMKLNDAILASTNLELPLEDNMVRVSGVPYMVQNPVK